MRLKSKPISKENFFWMVHEIILCQAGVVLETLDSALADQGMMVPLDLGAKVLMCNQKPTTNMLQNMWQKI